MGLIDTFFGKAINKRVQTIAQDLIIPAVTNLYNKNIFPWVGTGVPVYQMDNFDFIKKGFNVVGAVYECVDILAKKVVAAPKIVYRVRDEKEYKKFLDYSKSSHTLNKALIAKAKGLEEVSMPQIERLLLNPNPMQNGDDFYETLAGFFLLTGNAYAYGVGSNPSTKKWSEIYALPTQMKIIGGGPMEPVSGYVVELWNSEPYPADQVKHFKTFNPNYDPMGRQLYGLSPLSAYLYALDILKNSDVQADKQVKNGGIFGLITPENKEDQLSDEQKDDLKEQLQSARASSADLARFVPSSIALKYQQIGLPSSDIQLLETSGAKADDIYRAYHIPLQFRNQDSATYNNLPVANRKFVFDAVAPICRKFDVGLTEFICKPYNTAKDRYVIHSDYMALPEMNDDMQKMSEWLNNSPQLTLNEKREIQGFGRSTQPGSDEIFINRNTVRLQDVMDGKITTTPNDQSGTPLVN